MVIQNYLFFRSVHGVRSEEGSGSRPDNLKECDGGAAIIRARRRELSLCVRAPRIKRLLPVPGLKVKACGSERFGRIWIRFFS